MKLVLERTGFFDDNRLVKQVRLNVVPMPTLPNAPPVYYRAQNAYNDIYRERPVQVGGVRRAEYPDPFYMHTWLVTEEDYRRWARWARNQGYQMRRVFCEGEPIDFAPVAKCLF